MTRTRVVAAGAGICCLVIAGAAGSVGGTEGGSPPEAVSPVSPRAGLGEALVEARCPTFSWAGVEGAQGYELVVLAVPDASPDQPAEPRLATRAQLSAGARAWTPSLGSCLERGGHYAWSVRAMTPAREGAWSEPALFRVAAGPSVQEVEAAMDTLRSFLADQQLEGEAMAVAASTVERRAEARLERMLQGLDASGDRPASVDLEGAAPEQRRSPAPAELPAAGSHDGLNLALASAPILGSPSLSVSSNIALGAGSNLFKDGAVFLWDDPTTANTALGRHALTSATGTAARNTAVGHRALLYTTGSSGNEGSFNTGIGTRALHFNTTGPFNTATGAYSLSNNTTGYRNTASGFLALGTNTTGYRNTATGDLALRLNTTGHRNTASGSRALRSNSSGHRNTASGVEALYSNTTGHRNTASGALALNFNNSGTHNTAAGYAALFNNTAGQRNVAIGNLAGLLVTGSPRDDNIFISNQGAANDNKKIRIGTQGTQDGTFIAGIHGVTVTGSTVLVSSSGQLGVSSSSARFKEGVEELGAVGERLAALRPVTFRYRSEVLPDGGAQLGLLAEEVAELFPELVTRDAEGRLFGVRYDLLSVLSLAELQLQAAIVRAQGTELAEQRLELAEQRHETATLHQRVAALEAGEPREAQKRHLRWRRSGGSRDSP